MLDPTPTIGAMLSQAHQIAIVAVTLLSVCAQALPAQNGPGRLSVDGAVGAGHGWRGGERVDRSLIATDLLVVVRLAGDPRHNFLVGVEASRDLQLSGDKVCALRPDGGCIPQYPGFHALNVVAGRQWQSLAALRLRVLGGPGYYTSDFHDNSPATHSLGVGGRTDVAVYLDPYVAMTVAARGAWVLRVRDQSYVPSVVMIGLRFETGG